MEKDILRQNIIDFPAKDLTAASVKLFQTLGYDTSRSNPLPEKSYAYFKNAFPLPHHFNAEKALVADWTYFDILFQLSDTEISNQTELWDNKQVDDKKIDSYLFVAVGLKEDKYTRSRLAQVCREINKIFPMPVLVVFRYGSRLTLSVINRRINKRQNERDVLEKVTLIKDILVTSPHRAHIEILNTLAFSELQKSHTITNWVELHRAWQKTLDTEELNDRFYKDLYNWYEWALTLALFPSGSAKKPHILDYNNAEDEKEICKNLIRLITRLIFVWFLKHKSEKGLVPDDIFRIEFLDKLLVDFNPNDRKNGNYYNAVIQNLFFATLNREIKDREFAKDTSATSNEQYMIKFYFRDIGKAESAKTYYKTGRDKFIKLFSGVPFLNGGLFECLDYMIENKNTGKYDPYLVDGFSREAKMRSTIPNILFFGKDIKTTIIDGKKEKEITVNGIINIFDKYVFTIEENTPIDQDIALDPELLGKVFENLLATYNPETRESARNETGSFYTPREIVEYMVDTSLKEYFRGKLPTNDTENKLDALIQYNDEPHGFDDAEKQILIEAIDTCKILDPACGSGAFPMGVLHKLTWILGKLDPGNVLWKERQKKKLENIEDITIRKTLEETIDNSFKSGELDYSRKLYLIENCIFGVDIQTIAIQISKLRFFISLIVDQNIDAAKDNLGIIPLPNLETKFIAANTLVGLEKPSDELDNLVLDSLKKEMLDIRHKLFSARSAKEKLNYRKEEKTKREEIKKELQENSGWQAKSADLIVAWDPYDQNTSSSWFDAEWMFGVKEKDGFDVVIGNPPYISHDQLKDSKYYKKVFSDIWSPFSDIYCYFIKQGILLSKTNGILTFITSNSYIKADYGSSLRNILGSQNTMLSLINIEVSQVFSNAIVNTAILVVKTGKHIPSHKVLVTNSPLFNFNIQEYINKNSFYIKASRFAGINWVLEKETVLDILTKIYNSGDSLKGYGAKIRLGIATGDNKAFILNENDMSKFISKNKRNGEIIKPILRGRDIFQYIYTKPYEYIILSKNGIDLPKSYPDLAKHLESFGDKFKKRGAKGKFWWNLRACDFYDDFKKEKIIWIELTDKGRFAICKDEIYCINSAYFMIPPSNFNSRFLTGILNSKLIMFFVKSYGETSGMGTMRWINNIVADIPIPNVPLLKQQILFDPVNKIISAKAADSQADTSILERHIDNLVYRLYNLTYDEVKVIEPGFPQDRAEYEGINLDKWSEQ